MHKVRQVLGIVQTNYVEQAVIPLHQVRFVRYAFFVDESGE